MSTQSRSTMKSGFEAIGLAHGFLTDAARLGLTTSALQRLRESPNRMLEFVRLADEAEREHQEMLVEAQLEKERAVTIGGKHYHLVLVPKGHLVNFRFDPGDCVSEVVAYERDSGRIPLSEDAYNNAEQVVQSVNSLGQWLAWTDYGGLVVWERTTGSVLSKSSYGQGAGIRFDQFENVLGMVFMHECPDCDHLDTPEN